MASVDCGCSTIKSYKPLLKGKRPSYILWGWYYGFLEKFFTLGIEPRRQQGNETPCSRWRWTRTRHHQKIKGKPKGDRMFAAPAMAALQRMLFVWI